MWAWVLVFSKQTMRGRGHAGGHEGTRRGPRHNAPRRLRGCPWLGKARRFGFPGARSQPGPRGAPLSSMSSGSLRVEASCGHSHFALGLGPVGKERTTSLGAVLGTVALCCLGP